MVLAQVAVAEVTAGLALWGPGKGLEVTVDQTYLIRLPADFS